MGFILIFLKNKITGALMDFVSIQYLRAIAAIMVVVFHLEPQLRRMGYGGEWAGWLSSGVDIFFVISGFIMWVTTSRRSLTPIQFYWRRIVRIVPLYWLLTTVVVVVMLLSPMSLQSSRFDFSHVLASYFFVPWPHPVKAGMEPALIPGWTLNYEMFFYAIFGLTLPFSKAYRLFLTLFVLVLLVIIGLDGGAGNGSIFGFYSSSIILEFGLGMILGWYFQSGRNISPLFAAMLILIGVFIIIATAPYKDTVPRFQLWGFPAMAIVGGVLALEAAGLVPRFAILHGLGDASYSIYLSHGMVLSATSQWWRRMGFVELDYALIVYSVFGVAAAVVVGFFVFMYAERFLIRLLKN